MESLPQDKIDPNKREYHLNCKVKFVKGNTTILGKSVDRTMAILIPQESDQRTYFLSAWLPDVQEQYYEVVGYIPLPIDSNCRFSVHRAPDKNSDRHYLFVMTKGVEDILVGQKMEDITLPIRIFSEDHEEAADSVRDNDSGLEVYNES